MEKIGEKLISYGIIPRKSYGFRIVDELANNKHFWRGLIDADGCLAIAKNGCEYLFLGGCYEICSQYLDYCKLICLEIKTNIMKNNSIFKVCFNCDIAKFLVKHFYEGSKVYLDRKMKIANKIINYKRISRKYRKLTWEQVNFIRKLEKEKTQRELGRMFGVALSTINCILKNKTWKKER